MAKHKISEPITGVSFNPDTKLTVQKSRPLSALWNSSITLPEFKILDIYLSRINSHKPEQRTVRFEKGELEQLLGLKQIKKEVLDERLKNLMTTVRIPITNSKKGFTRIALFEQAFADQDENDLWQVDLTCTQSAMKYIFNIENVGYFKYKLKAITSIVSRYSYILFVYLEENRHRKSWEVSLEKLKEILNCKAERYNAFKFFNAEILKKSYKELTEKTPCNFKYEPIKKGRSVVAVRFTLETIPQIEIDPNQITLDEYEESHLEDDTISFLQGAVIPSGSQVPEFNRTQIAEILEVLCVIPDWKFPTNVPTGDIEFRRYHFLSLMYASMNNRDGKKRIKNRYAYFLKMLKSEAGIA